MAAERMLPPVSSNADAQNDRSRSSPSGSGGARQFVHSCSRSSSVGVGKSMMQSSRRVKASSMFARRLVDEDRQAVEGLHALQQVGALDVGVAVVGVAHLAALAEHRVGLVEQQHAVDARGLGEDLLQVLLGLADVLVDDRGEVHPVQVQPQLAGDHLGRHRLAGAGVAREQGGDADPAAAARTHPPLGEHLLAVPRTGGELAQLHGDGVGEHQVRPADGRLDAAGETFEPGGVLRPGTRLEQATVDGPLVEGRGELRPPDGAADLPGAEMQVERGPRWRRRGRWSTAARGRWGPAGATRPSAGPRGSTRDPS